MADGRLLFVGGCPRSGTTALARLLNAHPDVFVGNERYYRLFERGALTRAHFARERFLRIEAGDTHGEPPGKVGGEAPHFFGEDAPARYDGAAIVGDKYPPIWRAYGMVAERFADTHIVYILREPHSVAASYQVRADDAADHWSFDAERAVGDWNSSVAATLAAIAGGLDVAVVRYEAVLRSAAAAAALFARLGLPPRTGGAVDALLARGVALAAGRAERGDLRRAVDAQADFASYRALLDDHAMA